VPSPLRSWRALRDALGAHAIHHPGRGAASLEVSLPSSELPRTRAAALLCDHRMRAHHVAPDEAPAGPAAPAPTIAAFCDGVQESRVVAYVGGLPVVHARVAAVVRVRRDRRLSTWGDGVLSSEALYLPLQALPAEVTQALGSLGVPLVETGDAEVVPEEAHPHLLLRRAVHLVQREREGLERMLAEQWCAREVAHLYLDGGLPASAGVLASARVIGVVKSHHTLYVAGPALATVMALGAGERSSVLVVDTRWRDPVASWYLRLRAADGRDPLWGIARLEYPLEAIRAYGADPDVAANALSRAVLAEAAPLALPDARWDTMAYGIRDCEVYLRAALGRLAS
jgi:hypothetical protein